MNVKKFLSETTGFKNPIKELGSISAHWQGVWDLLGEGRFKEAQEVANHYWNGPDDADAPYYKPSVIAELQNAATADGCFGLWIENYEFTVKYLSQELADEKLRRLMEKGDAYVKERVKAYLGL